MATPGARSQPAPPAADCAEQTADLTNLPAELFETIVAFLSLREAGRLSLASTQLWAVRSELLRGCRVSLAAMVRRWTTPRYQFYSSSSSWWTCNRHQSPRPVAERDAQALVGAALAARRPDEPPLVLLQWIICGSTLGGALQTLQALDKRWREPWPGDVEAWRRRQDCFALLLGRAVGAGRVDVLEHVLGYGDEIEMPRKRLVQTAAQLPRDNVGALPVLAQLLAARGYAVADACLALSWAARSGHLEMVVWLIEYFALAPPDLRWECNSALRGACAEGHLDVLAYLVEGCGLGADDARAAHHEAVITACANGHLDVLKYLVGTVGLTRADMHTDGSFALRWACERQHGAVVRFLLHDPRVGWCGWGVERDGDVAEAERLAILQAVCEQNDPVLMDDVADALALTSEHVRARNNLALQQACRHDRLAAARWLARRFGLGRADARACQNLAVRGTRSLPVLRFLVEGMGLCAADLRAADNELLVWVCRHGTLAMLKYMLSPACGLGDSDLVNNDSEPLRAMASNYAASAGMLGLVLARTGITAEHLRQGSTRVLNLLVLLHRPLPTIVKVLERLGPTPADLEHLAESIGVFRIGEKATLDHLEQHYGLPLKGGPRRY